MLKNCLLYIFLIASASSMCQEYLTPYYKGDEFLVSQKDSTYHYYEKAIRVATNNKNIEGQLFSIKALLYANGYYYDLKTYKKNLVRFEKLLTTQEAQNHPYFSYFKDTYGLELVNYHFKLSNYPRAQKAIDVLEQSLRTRNDSLRDADYYEIAYSLGLYQASIYFKTSKVNLAQEKYEQLEGFAIKYKDSLYDPQNVSFSIKRLQAKTYAALGETDKAILSQIQALEIIKDNTAYTNSILDIELDLTANLLETKELKEVQELIEILEKKNIQKGLFKLRFIDQKICLSRLKNRVTENKLLHQEKIMEIQNYRDFKPHPDLVKAYISYAADELLWGDTASAFQQLELAKDVLSKMMANGESLVLSKLQLDLGAQYLKTYKVTSPLIKGQDVLKTTQDVLISLDALQPQFESKLDKQYLINNAYPSLQDAFILMYDLYSVAGERAYLDQAFAISEKSKAIELRSIRQAGVAQRSLTIAPEIIERENLFNYTINQLEKDLFTATANTQELQDSLLQQREAYGDFVYDLKDTQPAYYNVRYKNDVATLSQSIDYLSEDRVILSFFQVENTMYVFRLGKRESGIVSIPFTDEVQEQVRDFYTLLSRAQVKDRDALDTVSKNLYSQFIGTSILAELPRSLTIIPDGLLHYIPFEALQTESGYLLEKTTISYKPSVSFMQGLRLDEAMEAKFIGFAPIFGSENVLSLPDLSYNVEEVERANGYFEGQLFKGDEGSLVRFRESIKSNNKDLTNPIYHFATHAITNDSLPAYSYLAFTPKGAEEDAILYAKDLYNEQLNCAMVVLSACETGLGKIENGQGMQSLAQGFNYAGASSLLYSKWKVSDRYTADLMELFYKNLDTGLEKDKALQQAKIEYLNTIDDPNLAHPFYWASFVFSGDTTPLKSMAVIPIWLWVLGVLILSVLLVIFTRRYASR
jgi:CHAT domain-containing protein